MSYPYWPKTYWPKTYWPKEYWPDGLGELLRVFYRIPGRKIITVVIHKLILKIKIT